MENIEQILRELWQIRALQSIFGGEILTWTEEFLCNAIIKHYGINNNNSKFYYVLYKIHMENPNPNYVPSILDILNACKEEGIL